MIILGLDPGLGTTGWGVIRADGNRLSHVANGQIRTDPSMPLPRRLSNLYAALIDVIRTLPGTKLIATHDLDLVLDLCPRVLVLDAGRLAADGPADRLLADADLMERHGLEVPYRLRRS